ncbi:hypothetical protein BT93_L1429 [Corymbia citriodora subsp. variegata]|uniref:Antitoxin n=1 Tax=Corymbia citriodora subsp. variegata TaxID=360336 RepID=A0A8T0CE81_CORYI|nr:hypothetical protein BT93_L1429 [Corymbia citriodora subsp. variegata]
MSGLMDKAKDLMGKKENQAGQPGDSVESKADSAVNSKVDNFANQEGLPQGDDQMLNKGVDAKVNSDIPGGAGDFGNNS